MMEHNQECDHRVLNTKSRKLNRITGIASKISVEPTVFLTVFTSMMYQLTSQNVYLEKACRVNIGFNTSTCDALTTRNSSGYSKIEEIEVQTLVSKMLGVRTVVQSFLPFCLMLFVGSWTDRHNRRKPLILIPILGEIFCCILLIFNIIFFYELPLIFTTLGDSLPLALLGGWPCFFVGTYTFVGAQCDQNNRTTRMALLSLLQLTGLSLGLGLAGLIQTYLGFIGFFSFCICILITAFLLGMFLVKEKTTTSKREKRYGLFRDFFDIHYFVESLKMCFRRGENRRRHKIAILLIMAIIFNGVLHGELAVSYLYTRLKFQWNSKDYGLFTGILFSVDILGTIAAVAIFTKCLGFDDSLLGIVGLTGSVIGNIIYAFAPNGFIFYLGIFCDFFRIASYVAMKSIMSELVPPDELGQSNSVFGVCEAITPVIFGPLYTTIYNYTIHFFPGMYYLVTTAMKIFGLFLFIYLYLLASSEKRRDLRTHRCDSKNGENGTSEKSEEERNKLMDTTNNEAKGNTVSSSIYSYDILLQGPADTATAQSTETEGYISEEENISEESDDDENSTSEMSDDDGEN